MHVKYPKNLGNTYKIFDQDEVFALFRIRNYYDVALKKFEYAFRIDKSV